MKLSVIIPVHNGGAAFRACLEALAASLRSPDELIVVDDASSEAETASLARKAGAQVVTLTGPPQGPAFARNRGAEAAQGELLVFLDADVAVHPDTLTRIAAYFAQNPDVDALFGSYDAFPPAQGLVTRYKNLLHHYVHQHGRREASTFWAGCGAIRRAVFQAAGGFDEHYTRPSIEDIELGVRLKRAGHRIHLCPDVQVTHLKRWTFASWLQTDIFCRAVPWSRLLCRGRALPDDLNLGVRSRLSALAAWLAVVCLALTPWSALAWAGALLGVSALAGANADLFRFFLRKGGGGFGLGAFLLHALYLLYSSLTFGLVAGPTFLARRGLALLLLATLFKGLTWSVLYPPFNGPDEPQHFLYGQSVERFGALRVAPTKRLPSEARLFGEWVQFEKVRSCARLPLDPTDPASRAARQAVLNDPALKRTYEEDSHPHLLVVTDFNRFHPPGYYLLLGGVQWPLESASIAVRSLAGRWLSVALSLVTVWLAYRVGRELWPERRERALLLGTLVGFQPMLTFCGTVMINHALEIPLFSAFLLVSLRIARGGLSWRRAILLGLVIASGLLTRMSFLSVLPLLGLLCLWNLRRQRLSRQTLSLWTIVFLLPLLLCAWWYGGAFLGSKEMMVHSFRVRAEHPSLQLLPHLLHYPWQANYFRMLRVYWGDFGWCGPSLPLPRQRELGYLACALLLLVGGCFLRRWRQREALHRFTRLYCGLATLCVIGFYTYLDFRTQRDLGKPYGLQGRYFLAPIVGQMACLTCVLSLFPSGLAQRVALWSLGAGMIFLNLYALFGVVVPVHYATVRLLPALQRAALFQIVGPCMMLIFCVIFFALTGALLLALSDSRIFTKNLP